MSGASDYMGCRQGKMARFNAPLPIPKPQARIVDRDVSIVRKPAGARLRSIAGWAAWVLGIWGSPDDDRSELENLAGPHEEALTKLPGWSREGMVMLTTSDFTVEDKD
jgi:hypothetical protein